MKNRYKIITRGPSPAPSFADTKFGAILKAKLRSLTARNVEVVDTVTEKTIWPESAANPQPWS